MWLPIEKVPEWFKTERRDIVALTPEYFSGTRPLVLRWYKYNGTAAWRDWDNDAHIPTHWHPLEDLPNSTPSQ